MLQAVMTSVLEYAGRIREKYSLDLSLRIVLLLEII